MTESTMFWNSLELLPPKIESLDISGEKPSLIGSSLYECLDKISLELQQVKQLNMEGAIISRLVYRLKRKLRLDKGFKSLQKINHMLHNFLRLNLAEVIEEMRNCIFEKKGPSQEVLEWGLVNILRFSSLFNRIYIICLDGAKYIKDRLKSGEYWVVASIILAAVSRVWTIAQFFVKKAALWYMELKAYRSCLQSSGTVWLAKGFKLPRSVEEWLKHPSYLAKDESVKRTGSALKALETEPTHNESNISVCKSFIISEDLGERISRESGEVIPKEDEIVKNQIRAAKMEKLTIEKKSFKTKSKQFNSLKSLSSKQSIIEFLCSEGVLRKTKVGCLTKEMTDLKWNEMKRSVMKHVDRIDKCKNKKESDERLKRAIKCVHYYLFFSGNDERDRNQLR